LKSHFDFLCRAPHAARIKKTGRPEKDRRGEPVAPFLSVRTAVWKGE
jgi:hypothetical protein